MAIRPVRVLALGLLSWLIPFVAAVPFYGRDGELMIPPGVFKSLMVVVGSGAGAGLLVGIFRRRPASMWMGLTVGLVWLGINLGLDLLILVPLTGMSLPAYFGEIGLRYLVIPIMSVAMSVVGRDPASGQIEAAGDGRRSKLPGDRTNDPR